jgi:hypothetical protein
MNKFVQEYLEKKDAQKKEELKKQMFKVTNYLRIGKREYPENSDYERDDYPYWDTEKGKYYRYNVGDISEEEIKMLVQEFNDEPKFVEKAEKSNWYGCSGNYGTIALYPSAIKTGNTEYRFF